MTLVHPAVAIVATVTVVAGISVPVVLPVRVGRLVTDLIFDLGRFVGIGLVFEHRLLDSGLVVESLGRVSVIPTVGVVSVIGCMVVHSRCYLAVRYRW